MSEATNKNTMVVVKRAGTAVDVQAVAKPETELQAAVPPANLDAATEVVDSTNAALQPDAPKEAASPLFKESGPIGPKLPRLGSKVRATIFQLGAETVFCTIDKHEAMVALDELKDDAGILRFGVGDEIEAYVTETGAKGIVLSRKLPVELAGMRLLKEAQQAHRAVEGLVLGVHKGGLEVAVGEVRAFCPFRQVDIHPSRDLGDCVGQRFMFHVTEVKGRKVILSRRALLEEACAARAAARLQTLAVGQSLKATIVNIQPFGAFADIGGLEGLIPLHELSHQRLHHPSEAVKVGDVVHVEVTHMEEAQTQSPPHAKKRKGRVTLSMRKRMEAPFTQALQTLTQGAVVPGKVVRLQPFGAFVQLFPGVDGLLHISAMSPRRISHPRDVVSVGDAIQVKVEKVEAAEKRIALRLVREGVPVGEAVATHSNAPSPPPIPKAQKPQRGALVCGKVCRVENFGVFIEWEGHQGLIPTRETGVESGVELKKFFPMGKAVTAEITEAAGNKLKLSITAAQRSEERAHLAEWRKAQHSPVGGFNSLADKLKGLGLGN